MVIYGISGIILPNYKGVMINHYKDPYESTNTMESKLFVFFRGSHVVFLAGACKEGKELLLSIIFLKTFVFGVENSKWIEILERG